MSASIKSAPLRIASTAAEEVALTHEQLVDLVAANYCRKIAPCDKNLKVGIFFDGTNNNRQRDKLDNIGNRQKQYHSNIVRLYDAHKGVDGEGSVKATDCYRFYIPGVGTRFEEGGEYRESQDGKAMAKGGQARILFALLQIYNAIHQAFNDNLPMFDKAQLSYYIKKYVTDGRKCDQRQLVNDNRDLCRGCQCNGSQQQECDGEPGKAARQATG